MADFQLFVGVNFSPMAPKLVRTYPHKYSRKPGNYNGTIIFEIHIIKKSSPLNLKFTFFATVKTKITLLFSATLAATITKKTIKTFVKKSSLTKILIDWGGLFHDINLKNNGAIVISWFSTICG